MLAARANAVAGGAGHTGGVSFLLNTPTLAATSLFDLASLPSARSDMRSGKDGANEAPKAVLQLQVQHLPAAVAHRSMVNTACQIDCIVDGSEQWSTSVEGTVTCAGGLKSGVGEGHGDLVVLGTDVGLLHFISSHGDRVGPSLLLGNPVVTMHLQPSAVQFRSQALLTAVTADGLVRCWMLLSAHGTVSARAALSCSMRDAAVSVAGSSARRVVLHGVHASVDVPPRDGAGAARPAPATNVTVRITLAALVAAGAAPRQCVTLEFDAGAAAWVPTGQGGGGLGSGVGGVATQSDQQCIAVGWNSSIQPAQPAKPRLRAVVDGVDAAAPLATLGRLQQAVARAAQGGRKQQEHGQALQRLLLGTLQLLLHRDTSTSQRPLLLAALRRELYKAANAAARHDQDTSKPLPALTVQMLLEVVLPEMQEQLEAAGAEGGSSGGSGGGIAGTSSIASVFGTLAGAGSGSSSRAPGGSSAAVGGVTSVGGAPGSYSSAALFPSLWSTLTAHTGQSPDVRQAAAVSSAAARQHTLAAARSVVVDVLSSLRAAVSVAGGDTAAASSSVDG